MPASGFAGPPMSGMAGPPYPPFGPPTAFGPPVPPGPPVPAPRRSTGNATLITVVVVVAVVCLLGAAGTVIGGLVILHNKNTSNGSYSASSDGETADTPQPANESTTKPDPSPAPARVGECICVDEAGDFLGIGNCNGSKGTYRVLSVDPAQDTCSDPESPHITENGYRLCLELYLVRTYCYKFPQSSGWVVPASACKAAGTVLIVDIVPGADNDKNCTRAYQWNRWYRFTHPTVVYCVMQY
jgi:hypothetical protein